MKISFLITILLASFAGNNHQSFSNSYETKTNFIEVSLSHATLDNAHTYDLQGNARKYVSVTTKRWKGEATATSGTSYFIKNNGAKAVKVTYKVCSSSGKCGATYSAVIDAKSKKLVADNQKALPLSVRITSAQWN